MVTIIGVITLGIGIFAFGNIIGVLRTLRSRSIGMNILPLVVWSIILGILAFIIHKWFFGYVGGFYTGIIVSIILSWNIGKNGPEK